MAPQTTLEKLANDLSLPIHAHLSRRGPADVIALRLASPKRADAGKPIQPQHAADSLDLFGHAAQQDLF